MSTKDKLLKLVLEELGKDIEKYPTIGKALRADDKMVVAVATIIEKVFDREDENKKYIYTEIVSILED